MIKPDSQWRDFFTRLASLLLGVYVTQTKSPQPDTNTMEGITFEILSSATRFADELYFVNLLQTFLKSMWEPCGVFLQGI